MIARRGVSGTSVREVVRSTGTPRGSIAHHFPGGKQQLVEEAVAFAGQVIADRLEQTMEESGAVNGIRRFVSFWRQHLEATRFAAGCPVLAVSLEQADNAVSESHDADGAENAHLLDVSNAVFVKLAADRRRRLAEGRPVTETRPTGRRAGGLRAGRQRRAMSRCAKCEPA